MKRILLFGNPNVGKSAIFTRLTGVRVIASNYPGTTVEYLSGKTRIDNKDIEVIDVPGIILFIRNHPQKRWLRNLLMRVIRKKL